MKEETVWIWGRHPVLEAARAGRARAITIASHRKPSSSLDQIRMEARKRGIPVTEAAKEDVDRLAAGQNTQGVAAQVLERRLTDVPELLDHVSAHADQAFLLALDQVQDPQNVGSLLRTAEAAGVHGVLVPERRSAALGGAVAKASAGAASHLHIVEVVNLARALNELREAGIWVAGLDATAAQTVYSADLKVPLALVVGNEAAGLRRLTRQHCDFLVRLPMRGQIESLNAAVAGSIALYEVMRQRQSVQ